MNHEKLEKLILAIFLSLSILAVAAGIGLLLTWVLMNHPYIALGAFAGAGVTVLVYAIYKSLK